MTKARFSLEKGEEGREERKSSSPEGVSLLPLPEATDIAACSNRATSIEPSVSTQGHVRRISAPKAKKRSRTKRRKTRELTKNQDLPSSSFLSLRLPFLGGSPRIHSQSYERRSLPYSWSSCYLYDHSLLDSMGREEEGVDGAREGGDDWEGERAGEKLGG